MDRSGPSQLAPHRERDLRNKAFKVGSTDHHLSADLTGQADHLGITLNADIIKQKLPEVTQATLPR